MNYAKLVFLCQILSVLKLYSVLVRIWILHIQMRIILKVFNKLLRTLGCRRCIVKRFFAWLKRVQKNRYKAQFIPRKETKEPHIESRV